MLQIKKVNQIEANDWDKLVQETYNKPYNFQQQEGCQSRGTREITVPSDSYDYENETVPEIINGEEMGVKFSAWLARDPKEWNGDKEDERFLDLFWERNFYPSVEMLINDLYSKGLLEEGDYQINIDW
jgi:hypothetical protein